MHVWSIYRRNEASYIYGKYVIVVSIILLFFIGLFTGGKLRMKSEKAMERYKIVPRNWRDVLLGEVSEI